MASDSLLPPWTTSGQLELTRTDAETDAVRAAAVSALTSPSRMAIRSAPLDARAGGITSSQTPARQRAADRVSMKRFMALLKGLPGGHRPPTGPLTTSEAAEADELRRENPAKDDERIERTPEDAGPESDSTPS